MGADGNALGQRAIIELELGRVLSGTQLRGALSERLMGIKEEVEAAEGDIIVFLDEIHGWIEAGGSDGSDATGELKTAMARGRFPCIGATTNDEFREFIESDAAFERRFQTVLVEEPDTPTAIEITEGIQPHYEDHHGVDYTDEALEASVRMSRRYIHDRRLPDKAISVMDLAGSRAARRGTDEVGRRQIAEVVAESAGLPVDRLTQDDRQRFLEIEDYLRDEIVGQRHVIDTVSEVLRRNYAGFRGNRPIGSLLFLGPTGVGKTETVKVLADFLFHDRDAVVQIDMSEYMKSHSVSRFVGAPPGYVGHGQGGQLTEAIRRRPYQIVLLDELEKAHPEVLNVLLQVFEEGTLTDGKGRTVDFSNALIVMTSNLGSETFIDNDEASQAGPIGFGNREVTAERSRNDTAEHDEVLEAARDHLTPELWNRIDETLVFSPLSRDEIADIAQLQLQDSAERIRDESGIDMEYDSGVIDHLIENGGYDRELGARPMRQTIQRLVEGKVAREILRGEADRGDTVRVVRRDGELCCE
jgi:ATP-dependent Clp protease ATP-binding subunit ClpC